MSLTGCGESEVGAQGGWRANLESPYSGCLTGTASERQISIYEITSLNRNAGARNRPQRSFTGFFFHLIPLAGPANLGASRVFMARSLRVSLLIYPRESLPMISISLSVCERLT